MGVLLRVWVEGSVASAGGGGGDQLTVDSVSLDLFVLYLKKGFRLGVDIVNLRLKNSCCYVVSFDHHLSAIHLCSYGNVSHYN